MMKMYLTSTLSPKFSHLRVVMVIWPLRVPKRLDSKRTRGLRLPMSASNVYVTAGGRDKERSGANRNADSLNQGSFLLVKMHVTH